MPLPRTLERNRLGDLALIILMDIMRQDQGRLPENISSAGVAATANRLGLDEKELGAFSEDLFHLMADGGWRTPSGGIERVL